ncbi:MAG: glycerol-3-phosphate acyltransferase, partial [Candidatus Omnitrophica bacterium]|nr:glycerol-3-phosphate acyltransferase [Candidatus Omnitrophota bacterium]
MLWIIPALLVSYLIGSIPTAYIFAKVLKGIDIRKTGSGNVGATNAARILGKKTAIVILSLDILKGLLPVIFLGDLISPQVGLNQEVLRIMLGFSSIAGHNWTIFLGFRGGKGIATTLG